MGHEQHAQPKAGDRARPAAPARRPEPAGGLLALQRTAGNAAVAAVLQRDADRDQLLAALRSAAAQQDWRQVATRLNGLNADDIKLATSQLSLGQAANTRAAVLIFLDGWPQQQAILAGLDSGGPEVRRIGDLYAAYERAATASDWAAAADALAPMTEDDMAARLGRLTAEQRDAVGALAGDRAQLLKAVAKFSRLPAGTTYADVKGDLAYIDNFETASYDVFRRELHLTFEDGREVALPIAQTQASQPALSAKQQQQVAALQNSGDLSLPKSTAANGFLTVLGPDVFYNDPQTGLLRPQNLRPAVAPRLYGAISELDPGTQDLLYAAALGFVAGPPMPQNSEWLILLPALTKGGMALRGTLLRAAERKALTRLEAEELQKLATSGTAKRPYASSLGELEEAGVMAGSAPTATMAPPKMRAVDWYEGGKTTVNNVPEKFKGKPITVQETHVSGGTWTQLQTVLEKENATTANVASAVTVKLNKFWDRLHNPSLNKPARSPFPIAPDTYSRVYLDAPDALVVHIHLRESAATKELKAAAEGALAAYPSKGDLPPVRVVVTGKQ
jgi:hypothetical protein